MGSDEGQGDAKTFLYHLHKLLANTVRTPVCEEELLGVPAGWRQVNLLFQYEKEQPYDI